MMAVGSAVVSKTALYCVARSERGGGSQKRSSRDASEERAATVDLVENVNVRHRAGPPSDWNRNRPT